MKPYLLLAGVLLYTASAALAQTVVPPGSVPGAQTVTTPDMRNAGSPWAPSHDEKVPGMSHRDEKKLRKMSKVKSVSGDTKNARTY